MAFLLAAVCAACGGRDHLIRSKADAVIAMDEDVAMERIDYEEGIRREFALGEKFLDPDFLPASLKRLSEVTLRRLFESQRKLSFYSRGGQPHTDRLALVFEELSARGVATNDDKMDAFQAYLAARRIDRARDMKTRYPDAGLWDLPRIVGATPERPFRVYDILADSSTARVAALPIGEGARIVVTTWYACPIGKRALDYIEADPRWFQVMKSRGVVLTGRFEPGAVARRNMEFKPARTYIAFTERDWPGIDFGASPTFHFVRDGRVMHRFLGAESKDSFDAEFARGLAAIGVK